MRRYGFLLTFLLILVLCTGAHAERQLYHGLAVEVPAGWVSEQSSQYSGTFYRKGSLTTVQLLIRPVGETAMVIREEEIHGVLETMLDLMIADWRLSVPPEKIPLQGALAGLMTETFLAAENHYAAYAVSFHEGNLYLLTAESEQETMCTEALRTLVDSVAYTEERAETVDPSHLQASGDGDYTLYDGLVRIHAPETEYAVLGRTNSHVSQAVREELGLTEDEMSEIVAANHVDLVILLRQIGGYYITLVVSDPHLYGMEPGAAVNITASDLEAFCEELAPTPGIEQPEVKEIGDTPYLCFQSADAIDGSRSVSYLAFRRGRVVRFDFMLFPEAGDVDSLKDQFAEFLNGVTISDE